MTTCNYINLVCAALGKDPDYVKKQKGLPNRIDARKIRDQLRIEREASRTIMVTCDQCGNLFERPTYLVLHNLGKDNYQHQFCNRHCQGVWMETNYGFSVHPENVGQGFPKKWDWDMV